MIDDEDIETAARHLDWQGCARIMFGLLNECAPDEQREIAAKALDAYVKTWEKKHTGAWTKIPENLLTSNAEDKQAVLPDFPEELELDPGDAEFENGLIEFYNGAYSATDHDSRTIHFASAIRSSVAARQIDVWLCCHPVEFSKWKSAQLIDGLTFLDDEAAAVEAQAAWEFVDHLFKDRRMVTSSLAAGKSRSSKRLTALYRRWEASVL